MTAPVKVLHLRGALGAARQFLLRRRWRRVKRHDQGVVAQNCRNGPGRVPGALPLGFDSRLREALGHR